MEPHGAHAVVRLRSVPRAGGAADAAPGSGCRSLTRKEGPVFINSWQRFAGVLGALGIVAVLGCPGGSSPAVTAAARPECPADVILLPADSGLYSTTVIAASGPISLVPEFHDC